MEGIHYMISEAAKSVGVNSHTLRYWEVELNLIIGRTEMGHRYYTKDDIQLFACINKLKDIGVTLKELKELVPEIQKTKKEYIKKNNIKKNNIKKNKGNKLLVEPSASDILFTPAFPELDYKREAIIIPLPQKKEDLQCKEKEETRKYKPKYVKYQAKAIKKQEIKPESQLVDEEMVIGLKCALESNNVVLTEEVCKAVTASLKKEISYMLDAKELIEEEHFRKLDVTIRSMQQERKNQVKKGFKVRMRNVLGYE